MKQKITSLVIALSFLHTQLTYALPVKNNASNGVQFNKNQNTLNITAPDKSVINYDSFNIAANEAVNFVQPGASSSVLNRVLSGGASTINGALAANGNVLLLNPSGVMFGGGATVNVNSFIASTKNITDANFQAGLLKFEGSTSGTIVNNGLINGSTNVGLIAANIENKGTIKAGKNAGLIAGNTGSVSVDFDGDGLINFTADSSTIGSGTIKNSGTIKAGQVLLTANDVSNVLENVINNTGTIEATKAVTGENGAIQLISDASVKNTGNLKAPEGKIIINTGGDMNSEGTISAVDGEVDIDATGDVTSSGTLEAGKLTEKGATFGISGTFSVDESSLKNDDDAIEFTGDTTLTGNISDVDNIIVGGGVTLTLAADVTLTAGADTSSNTNVNDSSNMVPSTGGDFIWMADDAVIDGAGFNLTFDTKGTNSWLSGIVGVNDLTFLNGNADKVSNTVTYELKKDVSVTGAFTIGEGTSLYLYPLDATNAPVSDIKLTADKFVAGGTGTNAGSIRLQSGKNLTLDATSTTENSNVNFLCNAVTGIQSPDPYPYLDDIVYGFIGSSGSLTFLGDAATQFNVGISGANYDHNMIRVRGIDIGDNAGRIANVSINAPVDYLASEYLGSEDFNIHNSSKLLLHNDTLLGFKNLVMDVDATIDAGTNAIRLLSDSYEGKSVIGHLENVTDLEFIRDGDFLKHYDILNSINITGEFAVREGAILRLAATNPYNYPYYLKPYIEFTADRFTAEGDGYWAGAINLNSRHLTVEALSATQDSFINLYKIDSVSNTLYSDANLGFLGNSNTKFMVDITGYRDNACDELMVRRFWVGSDSHATNVDMQAPVSTISVSDSGYGDGIYIGTSDTLNSSKLIVHNDMAFNSRALHIDSLDASGYDITFNQQPGYSGNYIESLVNVNNLNFNTASDYDIRNDLDIAGVLTIGEGAVLSLDAASLYFKAASFAAGGTGETAGSINLNHKDVTFNATSTTTDSAVNFYINDQANDVAYSAGSLTFLGNENTKFVVGVANNDSATGNKIMVKGATLGDSVSAVANVELQSSISEISATADTGDDLTLKNTSKLILNADTNLVGEMIKMDSAASIDAQGHNLAFYNTHHQAVSSTIGSLQSVNNLAFNTSGYYKFLADLDISGVLSAAANVKLSTACDYIKAASYDLARFGMSSSTMELYNGVIIEATSALVDSYINFRITSDMNKASVDATFLGHQDTKFVVGIGNNPNATGNIMNVDGLVLGNGVDKVANVQIDDAFAEMKVQNALNPLTINQGSKLMLKGDITIAGAAIDMKDNSAIDAQGNNLNFYMTGSAKLDEMIAVNNLGLYSPESFYPLFYELGDYTAITGTFTVGADTAVNFDPTSAYNTYITAANFNFDGLGDNAGALLVGNRNLYLDATSASSDSIVNFYVTDKLSDTAYNSGQITFLGNDATKFVVGVSDNDVATGNKIMLSGVTLGDYAGRTANVELKDSVSEISTTGSSGGDFSMRNNSSLTLTGDATIAAKNVRMDAASSIDAAGNNLVIFTLDLFSSLGSLLNANNLTLVDGVMDGAKAQYELLVDTLTAGNITLGDEVKLRAVSPLTTITADNFIMGSNTELNAWQDTSAPEIDTNGDIILNTTNSAVLDFVACVENFTVDSAGTLSINYAAANNNINLTAGTSANLGGIQYVNTLSLNGSGATYNLNDNISLDGAFTVGEGVIANLSNSLALTADHFAFYSDAVGPAGSIALNHKDLTLQANSAVTDSNVNFYVTDQAANAVYSAGALNFIGNAGTKFVVGVANNDSSTGNKIMTKGLTLGDAASAVANVELKSSISELSATADIGDDLTLNNASKLIVNSDTALVGEMIKMDSASSIDAQGHNIAFYNTHHQAVSSTIGLLQSVNNLSFNTSGYYKFLTDLDISGVLSAATNVKLSTACDYIKAASYDLARFGMSSATMELYNGVIIEATSALVDSYINFRITSDMNKASVDATFLGHQDTKFVVGVGNNPNATGNILNVDGLVLGNGVDKVANVQIDDAFSELAVQTGGSLTINDSSTLLLQGDTTISGSSVDMKDNSAIDAQGNNLNFYMSASAKLDEMIAVNNLGLYSPESVNPFFYELGNSTEIAGTLTVGADTAINFEPTPPNTSYIKAANFNFDGLGDNAGALLLGNQSLTLEATSATADSKVNFYVTDKLSDTAYNSGQITFLGNPAAKFVVGVSGNDVASGNKIMLSGITLGNYAGNTANLELENSVSEISAAGSSGGNFQMYNASKLTLTGDATVVGKRILMDANSTVDAANHNLSFYATHEGGISNIANLDNLNKVNFNGVTTGNAATFNINSNLTATDEIAVGDYMKIVAGTGVNSINSDNVLFLGNYAKLTLTDTPLALTAANLILNHESTIDANNNDLIITSAQSAYLRNFLNLNSLTLNNSITDGSRLQYDLTNPVLIATDITVGDNINVRGWQETTTITANNLTMGNNTQLNAWDVDTHDNLILDIANTATLDEIVCVENLTLKGGGRFFLKDNITQLNVDGNLVIGEGVSDGTNLTLGNDTSISAHAITMGLLSSVTGEGFNLNLSASEASTLNGAFNGVADFTLYNTSYTINDGFVIDGDFRALSGVTLLLNDTNLDFAANSFEFSSDSTIEALDNQNLGIHAKATSTLYNIDLGTGALTLEGTDVNPTDYNANGTITCSNSNTPILINANLIVPTPAAPVAMAAMSLEAPAPVAEEPVVPKLRLLVIKSFMSSLASIIFGQNVMPQTQHSGIGVGLLKKTGENSPKNFGKLNKFFKKAKSKRNKR